jgi:tRNA(Ile)-lysidine synthetase-like protein
LEKGSSGRRVRLPDGLEVWREFDALVFVPSPETEAIAAGQNPAPGPQEGKGESAAEDSHGYRLSTEQPAVRVAGIEITVVRGVRGSALKEVLERAREQKAACGRDWGTAALDEARVPETLIIRGRREGETALVLGQRKNKKLKKLMIDHKIAASRRTSWPIVATLDGEYVWSPGLPPAVNYAADDKTEILAILCASEV